MVRSGMGEAWLCASGCWAELIAARDSDSERTAQILEQTGGRKADLPTNRRLEGGATCPSLRRLAVRQYIASSPEAFPQAAQVS